MNRETMKQTIKGILLDFFKGKIDNEDASEAVVKVFERLLEESISESLKMMPELGKILKGASCWNCGKPMQYSHCFGYAPIAQIGGLAISVFVFGKFECDDCKKISYLVRAIENANGICFDISSLSE